MSWCDLADECTVIRLATCAAAALLIGGCAASGGSSASSARSPAAVRQAMVDFQSNVQRGRYHDACAMYTKRVLTSVGGTPGCVRQLTFVHDLAARERAHGLHDVLSETIDRAKAMRVTIRGRMATTGDLGRPGTVTRFIYASGRWRIDRPAT